MKIFSMMLQASVYRIPVGRARHRELMTRSHRDPAVPRSWNTIPTLKFASLRSLWRRKIGHNSVLRLKPGQAEPKRDELVSFQPCMECWGLEHGSTQARLPIVELHDPIEGTRRLVLCIKA